MLLSCDLLLKSHASHERPLLFQSTTDLLRTTVKLPRVCVVCAPPSCKLLCHSPRFLPLITIRFSSLLPSHPLLVPLCATNGDLAALSDGGKKVKLPSLSR